MFLKRLVFIASILFTLGVACEPTVVAPPTATRVPPTATNIPATPTVTGTPLPVAFPTAMPSPTGPASASPPAFGERALIAPVVQLVSPSQNAQISVNQLVNLVIFAAGENNIARVEVTDDGNPVRVDNPASPVASFSVIVPWTPNQIGTHVLRAVAYDPQNRPSPPDEVTVSVIQDARKPTSIIVYPIGIPQIDFGNVLPIYGVATDEVGVTQVELWVDNQLYTYLAAPLGNVPPAFPFVFNWTALSAGNHTFFVRAYDTQAQTTDSAPLKILVVDNQIPSVSVLFDRTNAPAGEPVTITVNAVDITGIQKIEFVSGKDVFSTFTNPARQAVVSTQVVLQNPNPGDYAIVVKVYNAGGTVKESPPQIVSFLRPGQTAPTLPMPTPTRTRTPRATATPRVQPPPAPKANIISPSDRFNLNSPLRVTFNGQANSELERIELWAMYPGQANAQVVCTIDARSSTQKTGQCDWTPPLMGNLALYAQAVDIYRQVGRSNTITGFVGAPSLPTGTPTFTPTASPTLTVTPAISTTRWSAVTSAGPMTVTVRQTGNTLRGDFKSSDGTGRVNGTARLDRWTFSVDFTPEGATPPANALTLEFDCTNDVNAGTLSCAFRDARGRTGAAFFRREASP